VQVNGGICSQLLVIRKRLFHVTNNILGQIKEQKYCLVGCDTLYFDRYVQTFRRNLLPRSSGFDIPKDSNLRSHHCMNFKSHEIKNNYNM
jgi:hypothetical protein